MNHTRRDRFTDRLAPYMKNVDNELQMLVDTFNRHESGLVGWTAVSLKDGSNKRMGQATLIGGSSTVSNTSVTASTRIFLSRETLGGAAGHLAISARVAGTSFTILSSSGTETSTVNWLLIEPK